MIKHELKIVYVPIEKLIDAEYNPRKATEKDFDDLRNNLAKFGLLEPIVVNSAEGRKNVIIGGHFRVKVARGIDVKKMPVVYVNIPDLKEEKELNVRLNKNTGSFDKKILKELFFEGDLKQWGFLEKDLKSIFEDDSCHLVFYYSDEKYLSMVGALSKAKKELGFNNNEDLTEHLLEQYVI